MTHHALTVLSDDEKMSRGSRRFAKDRIDPMSPGWTGRRIDKTLIPQLFDSDGDRNSGEYDGAGGTFMQAIRDEALAAVDPSVSVMMDVQNTLVINALINYGNEEQKRKYLPKLATECGFVRLE